MLGANKLRTDGAIVIAEAMKENKSLVNLDLRNALKIVVRGKLYWK